jgi:hypothetical protein
VASSEQPIEALTTANSLIASRWRRAIKIRSARLDNIQRSLFLSRRERNRSLRHRLLRNEAEVGDESQLSEGEFVHCNWTPGSGPSNTQRAGTAVSGGIPGGGLPGAED